MKAQIDFPQSKPSDINILRTNSRSRSYSSSQKYQINVDFSNPEYYDFFVDNDQVLSINSTLPYLTVMFTALPLCKIRAFKSSKRLTSLKEYQEININSDFAGFDFGCDIGHLEFSFFNKGPIQFSLMAFPKICGDKRLIVHAPDYKFILSSVISQNNFYNNNNTLCIFTAGGDATVTLPNHLRSLSLDLKNCYENYCKTIANNESTSTSFLMLTSPTVFYSYYYSFDIHQKNYKGSYRTVKLVESKSISVIRQQSLITPIPLPKYEENHNNTQIIYVLLCVLLIVIPVIVIVLLSRNEPDNDDQHEPLLLKSSSNPERRSRHHKKEKGDLPKVNFENFSPN